jgi:formylglycine-generating enzyme required for sulfatase activity
MGSSTALNLRTAESIDALKRARCLTDELFSLVRPGAIYDRPIPERHRIIFYPGHLEAFDWNLFREGLGLAGFHPEFDRLFAFGIDPGPGQLPSETTHDWPPLEAVSNYGSRVRSQLEPHLDRIPETLLHVAIEHRLMHAETFAYMLHSVPLDRKIPRQQSPPSSGPSPRNQMVDVSAGDVILGRKREDGFGWDNEFAAHTVHVPAFAINRYKITNGEYLRFVEAGGPPPHFWICRSGKWFYRGMFAEIPLPLDWPVYVTHDQASRYAAWLGKRLPTEAEFHRAAFGSEDETPAKPLSAVDNFDFHRWDPCPVQLSTVNRLGIAQMVGNGWEWTSTIFHPFPGFQPFPFYPGYSADFFDGQHYVLKGASPRTAACLTRQSFRNWFRPSYPHAYTTFRLVES